MAKANVYFELRAMHGETKSICFSCAVTVAATRDLRGSKYYGVKPIMCGEGGGERFDKCDICDEFIEDSIDI